MLIKAFGFEEIKNQSFNFIFIFLDKRSLYQCGVSLNLFLLLIWWLHKGMSKWVFNKHFLCILTPVKINIIQHICIFGYKHSLKLFLISQKINTNMSILGAGKIIQWLSAHFALVEDPRSVTSIYWWYTVISNCSSRV